MVARMGTDDKGKVTNEGTPFLFTPVFFFPEWCVWNPLELKDKLPMIRERTFDPQNPIAKKARDPQLRFEPFPDNPQYKLRYVEHLNFVIMLDPSHEFGAQPIILTFCRGEHVAGSRLCSAITMRKAPLYGCVFEGRVGTPRANERGSWYGLDARNPESSSPWVEKGRFEAHKAIHEEFKALHADAKVRVDYDKDSEADPAATAEGPEKF